MKKESLQIKLRIYSIVYLVFALAQTVNSVWSLTVIRSEKITYMRENNLSESVWTAVIAVLIIFMVIDALLPLLLGVFGLLQADGAVKGNFNIALAGILMSFNLLSFLLQLLCFLERKADWVEIVITVTSAAVVIFYISTAIALRGEKGNDERPARRGHFSKKSRFFINMSEFPLKRQILVVAVINLLMLSLFNIIDNDRNDGEYILYLITSVYVLYAEFFGKAEILCRKNTVLRLLRLLWRAVMLLLCGVICFLVIMGNTDTATGDEKTAIVLGTYINGTIPGELLTERLDSAVKFTNENADVPLVLSGGQADVSKPAEAEVMARYLIDKGIDPEKLMIENRSKNTYENFIFSRELIEQNGYTVNQPTVIITNSFHSYRARCYAERAGFTDINILPVRSQWQNIPTWYLREAVATIFFWFSGKQA